MSWERCLARARNSRRVRELASVGDVGVLKRTHLVAFQRGEGDGVAIVSDEFHFKGGSIAMDEDGGADIADFQTEIREVARERNGVEFVDGVHSLGSG